MKLSEFEMPNLILKVFWCFTLTFFVYGCKQFTRNSNQHMIEMNKVISYKSRALKISANEFNFEQRITYRNSFYEPYPVDLLYVIKSSDEFEKHLEDRKIKRIEGKVYIKEFNADMSKIYIFKFKDEKWYLSFGYIVDKVSIHNDYSEPGMQEFERIVEQLECQKEKRGLLND